MKKTACTKTSHLSKTTFLAMLIENSNPRIFFENMEDDSWTINSFDPATKTVCVSIASSGSIKTISVVLPFLTPIF